MNNLKYYLSLLAVILLSMVLIVNSSTIERINDPVIIPPIQEEIPETPSKEPVEENKEEEKEEEEKEPEKEEEPVQPPIQEEPEPEPQPVPQPSHNNTFESIQPSDYSMADCLMIGDSRFDDMKLYGHIYDADFFSNVGMSLHHYQDDRIDVKGIGSVTLNELLQRKSYNKVYIMLGLNDLGRNYNLNITKYSELLNLVRTMQPSAKIIIMSNLHVSKAYSQSASYENNDNVNQLNNAIHGFVDNSTSFYMDSNIIFDDYEGFLRSDLTNDGVHPKGNCYANWSEWIKGESRRMFNDH